MSLLSAVFIIIVVQTTEKESEKKLSVTGEIMFMFYYNLYLACSKMKKAIIPCQFGKSTDSSTHSKKREQVNE